MVTMSATTAEAVSRPPAPGPSSVISRLAEHLDHRDRRADRRLETELGAPLGRGREQVGAAAGDELLVRGDDGLPGAQQLEHVFARGLEAAHELRDDGDRRVVADLREI